MKITVSLKLFASLAKYKPCDDGPTCYVTVPVGTTVADLARDLAVPLEKVRMILINETTCDLETVLAEGDYIVLFPTIAGG